MPGKTQETGTVRALRLGDYQSKYPKMHVVIASKSTKANAAMDQVGEYLFSGYVHLEDTAHPDLVCLGKPREGTDSFDSWDKQREEELALANSFGVASQKMEPKTLRELTEEARADEG